MKQNDFKDIDIRMMIMKPRILACLLVMCCFSFSFAQNPTRPLIHAHRGGAAEYPENTIEAMLHAASIGVPVLELDVHVSADSLVVVSHDPYMSPKKALRPSGKKVLRGTQFRHILFNMPYSKIATYDVGSLPNKDYPNRVNIPCKMPLLGELIREVEEFTRINQIAPITNNIEIKSHAMKDNRMTPQYDTFIQLVMEVLAPYYLGNRLIIQSFDERTLNYLHAAYPDLQLSYLIEGRRYPIKDMSEKLQFTPTILSPHYQLVNPDLVEQCHRRGIQIVPWTVDHRPDILFLWDMGVDGIITNCPKQALEWIK